MPLNVVMAASLNFTTMVNLSTMHTTAATRWMIENVPPERWPFRGCKDADGWFMYAHDENAGVVPIPPDLWDCCEFARECGASWIRFDRDEDELGASDRGLPLYAEQDDGIGLLWWVFESEAEWTAWRDEMQPKGVQVLDVNRILQQGRINVTFSLLKARANEILGYEVNEDEWLEV